MRQIVALEQCGDTKQQALDAAKSTMDQIVITLIVFVEFPMARGMRQFATLIISSLIRIIKISNYREYENKAFYNEGDRSMNQFINKKLITQGLLIVVSAVLVHSAFAHTRLKVPVIDENAAFHGSNYNDVVVAHGCQNEADGNSTIDTIGTVVVFPDGKDSIITVDGAPHNGQLTDFVTNWASPVTIIQDRSVFTQQSYIADSLGNKLGFWAAGGNGLKAGYRGLLPFATAGVVIDPASCAKSVTFVLGIADVCEVTDSNGFSNATVQLWTPAVGSNFDGTGLHGFDSPATLKVNRTIAPLPESCGAGVDVVVKPSAQQLNRDMKVIIDGQQIWPKN